MSKSDHYGTPSRAPVCPVRAIITVVCDDTKTAVAYFNLLRQKAKKDLTVHVVPAPDCGADATKVIEHAASKRSTQPEDGDAVFVLIDVDTNPDVNAVRALGTTHGVTVLLSKPCYEVWTLAHLQDTGEAFADCAAVVRRIKAKWEDVTGQAFGTKAQADYRKIMGERASAAIARCQKRKQETDQPWTEVWRAVKAIVQ